MPAARQVPVRRASKSRPAPLSSLAQMRALAHPLRLQLLELFALAPRTTKQAAEVLGQPPTRLYHHVASLERVGLVRLRETRPNRGTIEKHFEAVAPLFRLDESVFGPSASPIAKLVAAPHRRADPAARAYAAAGPAASRVAATLFAEAQAEFAAALRARPAGPASARPMGLRMAVYATRAQIAQLQRAWLAALAPLRERSGAGGARPSRATERWTLTAAIVPAPLGAPPESPATAAAQRPRARRSTRSAR